MHDSPLTDQVKNDLRDLFNDMSIDLFEEMANRIEEHLVYYIGFQKWHISELNSNASTRRQRAREFKRHAIKLVEWMKEDRAYGTIIFNGTSVTDNGTIIHIAEPDNAIIQILEHEFGNADNVINEANESIKRKKRMQELPTAPRHIFINGLATVYEDFDCGNPWIDTKHDEVNPSGICGNWDNDAYFGRFLTMAWVVCKPAGIDISISTLHDYIKRCLMIDFSPRSNRS